MRQHDKLFGFCFGCLFAVVCVIALRLLNPSPAYAQEQTKKWKYALVGGVKNGLGMEVGFTMQNANDAGKQGWEAVCQTGDGTLLVKRLR